MGAARSRWWMNLGLALSLGLLLAGPASATMFYPDYLGTTIDFTGINETSQAGDPEPLFGAPLGVGDTLLFFPTTFGATATGAGGADTTHSLLQVMMTATSGTIDTINLTEFGDTTLSGTGTAATNTAVNMSGFATVLMTSSFVGIGTVIPFSIGDGNVSFAPGNTFDLPSDGGAAKTWSGSASIDVAAALANMDATQVLLTFNNQLDAFSESGSSATIQKKVVSGPSVVISVPEPGGPALLGVVGLLGLLLAGRRR